ncbi:putative deoxyribonuclease TATDN2 [Mycena sanguinolenta]|uniref:Putative deoxyribonuclease TATDN2 n=1 Tax=Mycena sanguinolenta TaxID=230812 RepID=A0A8H6WXY5_9AGAR|nr:putative deoxyribonuclease TATDN2 [Mycena sanguinolenta]
MSWINGCLSSTKFESSSYLRCLHQTNNPEGRKNQSPDFLYHDQPPARLRGAVVRRCRRGGYSRSDDAPALRGEIGFDYHYDNSPRPVQQAIFARQPRHAVRLGKPLTYEGGGRGYRADFERRCRGGIRSTSTASLARSPLRNGSSIGSRFCISGLQA